jgi:hemerythrin-like metal-binding protein
LIDTLNHLPTCAFTEFGQEQINDRNAMIGGNHMNQHLFIQWTDHNETGIPLIDEQHRGIVSIINTFYYLMGHGDSNNHLYSCISDTMRNYSHIHFTTEEGLLQAAKYKDLENHKKLHKDLTLNIERIERECVSKNDVGPLLAFLKKWWMDHINEQDMLYAPYLREHG